MKFLLLFVAVTMMFSGGQSYSESMSCSTVNGKTICNSEKGPGNVAGSSSRAISGDGGSYQDSYAMRGDSGTGQGSSSYSQRGNPSNGGFGPNPGYFGPNFGTQGANSGSRSQSYANSGSQAFAGAGPAGPFDPFAFAGLPNPFFGFGFAGRR